jgi:hypothetical protein
MCDIWLRITDQTIYPKIGHFDLDFVITRFQNVSDINNKGLTYPSKINAIITDFQTTVFCLTS